MDDYNPNVISFDEDIIEQFHIRKERTQERGIQQERGASPNATLPTPTEELDEIE